MNLSINRSDGAPGGRSRMMLLSVFMLYLFLSGFTLLRHEMWGDEIHSWNIAKGSTGFFNLIDNTRYEGHPPVWYIIMWSISKFTHDPAVIQFVHWLIAALTIFLLLFFSPLPTIHKMLVPFGYYFLYEYSILTRNYAIGVLLTICICIIITKEFRYKTAVYYFLLFLLSNTHLLGILMAASLHLYFLLRSRTGKAGASFYLHAVAGVLVILPSVYFIFPPSDSQMNVSFWLNRWGKRNFINFGQAPLRSFIPVSAWWEYHFWNSHFLMAMVTKYDSFLFINITLSIVIMTAVFFILKDSRKSVVLFFGNLFFSFVVAMTFFTLGAARYAGFLFIGFIAAYWLYCYDHNNSRRVKQLVTSLLLFQVLGSVTPLADDIRYPFSNANKAKELIHEVPAGEKIVTDYWALNAMSAFADTAFYCIDLQKEISFLRWDGELKSRLTNAHRYRDGLNKLFQLEGRKRIYFISSGSLADLQRVDPDLSKDFTIQLIDNTHGAIEKASDLYLYEIGTHQ